jgi:hypothetical protein
MAVGEQSETKSRPVIRFNENIPAKLAKAPTKSTKVATPPEIANSKLMASYSRLAPSVNSGA